MDASSILTTLLSTKSVNGISKATEASTSDVKNILTNAVPVLLQGANKQTAASTAKSFTQALADHATQDTSNLTSFFKNVDLNDGSKILSHLLTSSAIKSIAKSSGTAEGTTKSVLSAATPLFMSLLGQQTGGSSASAISSLLTGLSGSSSVTNLLGGLLGAGSSSSASGKKDDKKGKKDAASIASGLMGLLK